MLRQPNKSARGQIGFYSLEELVPQDHYLREIDQFIDFDFIYDLVKPLYDEEEGRPAIDPVTLIKLPLLQYLENIKSMWQTVKQVEVIMLTAGFWGYLWRTPSQTLQPLAKIIPAASKGQISLNKFFIIS